MTNLSFQQATEALQDGLSVRRPDWPASYSLSYDGTSLRLYNDHTDTSKAYTPPFAELVAKDWELADSETFSFEEAVQLLHAEPDRHAYRRTWPERPRRFLRPSASQTPMLLLRSGDGTFDRYHPTLSDVLATDWIVPRLTHDEL